MDVSVWTVRDAIKAGQIPTVRIAKREYGTRGGLARIINGEVA